MKPGARGFQFLDMDGLGRGARLVADLDGLLDFDSALDLDGNLLGSHSFSSFLLKSPLARKKESIFARD